MIFDEVSHTYTDAGIRIPSVTQVLAPSGWYAPEAAQRGIDVHEACVKWARGLDGFEEAPYVDSFVLWHFKHNPTLLSAEDIVDGSLDGIRYAGRYDLYMMIDGKRTLIDLKTGVKAPWHQAQIAAYALAVLPKPARCLILYLHDDMTYTEDWLTSSQLVAGCKAFQNALRKYNGKDQNDKA